MDTEEKLEPTAPEPLSEGRICPKCGTEVPLAVSNCPKDGTVMITMPDIGGALSEKYEIIGELGRGGIGVVYKARQRYLDKLCAIKMLHAERLSPEQIARFHQEAVALSKLRHANLVSVVDFGVTPDNVPYMVMDFIRGTPLTDLIADRRSLSPPVVVDILIQLARAMSYAHAQGVLHRDLKPGNVIVANARNRNMVAYILDFGIAKLTENQCTDASLTKTGDIFGSPLYMSPEQAQGKRVDERTDIYSLGCVMFEALSGRPPFTGDSHLEVLMQKLQGTAPDLAKISEGKIPPSLAGIVSTALQRDPELRFRTMTSFEQTLSRWRSTGVGILSVDKPIATGLMIAAVLAVVGCLALVILANSPQPAPPQAEPKIKVATAVESEDLSKDDFVQTQIHNENGDLVRINAAVLYDDDLKPLQKKYNLRRLIIERWAETTSTPSEHGVKITDRACDYFDQLPLRELTMREAKGISDEALKKIGRMDSLSILNLEQTRITDRGVPYLAPLAPKLTCLDLVHARLTDLSTREIGRLSNLTDLNLNGCRLTGEGLRNLCALKKLVRLEIAGNRGIKPADLAVLKQLPNLRTLNVDDLGLTDANLGLLLSLHLSQLSLNYNPGLGDAGLQRLSVMKDLQALNAVGCGITSLGARRFASSRPDVELTLRADKLDLQNLHWDRFSSITH